LSGRGREAAVAATAGAAARDHDPRARARQVGDQLPVPVEHLRPGRDVQLDIGAGGAVPPGAPARASLAGLEALLGAEAGEVAQVGVGHEHDVAAGPAVAAVRAAAGNVLLPPEAERA